MTKGAIQASNQAKREQIIHVGQNHKIEMKLDRKRTMQKEEDNVEKQTKLIAVAVKNGDCMDVDLAFERQLPFCERWLGTLLC